MHSIALPSLNGQLKRENDRFTNTCHVTNLYNIPKTSHDYLRYSYVTVILMYSVGPSIRKSTQSEKLGPNDLPLIGIRTVRFTAEK